MRYRESSARENSERPLAFRALRTPDEVADVDRAAHDELGGHEASGPGVAGELLQPGRVQGVVLRGALEVVVARGIEHPLEDFRGIPRTPDPATMLASSPTAARPNLGG